MSTLFTKMLAIRQCSERFFVAISQFQDTSYISRSLVWGLRAGRAVQNFPFERCIWRTGLQLTHTEAKTVKLGSSCNKAKLDRKSQPRGFFSFRIHCMLRFTGKQILVSCRVWLHKVGRSLERSIGFVSPSTSATWSRFSSRKKRPSTAIPGIQLRRCLVGAIVRGGCEASNSGQKTSVTALELAPIFWVKVAFQGGTPHANWLGIGCLKAAETAICLRRKKERIDLSALSIRTWGR